MTDRTTSSCAWKRAGFAAGTLCFVLGWGADGTALRAAGGISTVVGPVRVVDGDTLDIGAQRIRLEGIDAPELSQSCTASSGATWPCGRAATAALRKLTEGKDVACDSRGLDKYGRMLGVCFEDGVEINAEMVRMGLAWAFVKYSQAYVSIEAEAHKAKVGLWQGPAEPAWDYRRHEWANAEQTAPKGCAIKGNVSAKGRIYHLPWSPWYDRVTVKTERGERWFCSESEAIVAGWRPAAAN